MTAMHSYRVFRQCLLFLSTALLCTVNLSWSARAADKPTSARTDTPVKSKSDAHKDAVAATALRNASAAAVTTAVKALQKEFEAHVASPASPISEKATYFVDHPNPAVTPDAILDALDRNYGPPAESCYVKWQLLGGLPAALEPAQIREIAQAYQQAPAPMPHPSLTSMQKSTLDSQISRTTQADEAKVSEIWNKAIATWTANNAYCLNYADGLFGRLPQGGDAISLGLNDAVSRRAAQGVAAGTAMNNLITMARTWAASAEPRQSRALAQQFARVGNMLNKQFPPEIYTSVSWDPKANRMVFKAEQTPLVNPKTIEELVTYLNEQANQPSDGGLQTKETGHKK